MNYTVYAVKSKKELVKVCTIAADTLAEAYTIAEQITGHRPDDDDDGTAGSPVRVYINPTLDDGGATSIIAGAQALRSFERWEYNNRALENPRKRKPDERENLTQDAAVAIWAAMQDGTTDAATLHRIGWRTIAAKQKDRERVSARVGQYDPTYHNHNFVGFKPVPTCATLCDLVWRAIRECGLTAKQAQALDLKIDSNLSFSALAELLKCNKRNAAKNCYAAQVKILSYLLECPELEDVLQGSGLTTADIETARAERTKKDKKAKGRK